MRYQTAKFLKSLQAISIGRQKIAIVSSVLKNQLLDIEYRTLGYYYVNATSSRGCFVSRFKSRCVFTGRSRFVLTNYRISRLKFKEICTASLLAGFKKSQW